jgi:hypothetical protein
MSGVNEWLISLSEYIGGMSDELDNAMAENAKLRELVRDMWPHVRHRASMCASCELPCDASDECLLYEPMRRSMRELGVEVDE